MIPEHRLAVLFDKVKTAELLKCLYHNTPDAPSLFTDHTCERNDFPLKVAHTLAHKDEVWFCEFSHDGSRLATAGKEGVVGIYDTSEPTSCKLLHQLKGHTSEVMYLAWSHNDEMIITCSKDHTAKIWDSRVSSSGLHTYLQS